MSLLAKLLGWTGLPTWALEVILVLVVAGGVWVYHEHVVSKLISAGRAQQQADDLKALDALKTDRDKQQELIQARAEEAQHAYEQEQADLRAYRITHPDGPPNKLCINTPYRGSPDLHGASAANRGAAASSAPTPVLQPLPQANTGSGPDRRRLLDDLAAMADTLSATLRESQHR